ELVRRHGDELALHLIELAKLGHFGPLALEGRLQHAGLTREDGVLRDELADPGWRAQHEQHDPACEVSDRDPDDPRHNRELPAFPPLHILHLRYRQYLARPERGLRPSRRIGYQAPAGE